MGAGKNLKNILRQRGLSVREAGELSGIKPQTLYSIIHRDSSIRYAHAEKLANALGVPMDLLCNNDSFENPEEVLSYLDSADSEELRNTYKRSYIANQTAPLIEYFSYQELPTIDELITKFYTLSNEGRYNLLSYLNAILAIQTDPKRKEEMENIDSKLVNTNRSNKR